MNPLFLILQSTRMLVKVFAWKSLVNQSETSQNFAVSSDRLPEKLEEF